MNTFQIRTFLTYWLDAVDRHSLHSPFFFDLHENVIKTKDHPDFPLIEQLRRKLLHNPTPILVEDLGAGSRNRGRERTIREIARSSLSPKKYSQLYARLIRYYMHSNIIELGTSLGINALYLASAGKSKVTSFEGSPAIASVARSTFEFAGASNINLIEGNIDSTLPKWLEEHDRVDLAFIDANHRYLPTMRYFQHISRKAHSRSAIVIDDIHYTPDMEKAWNEIKNDPLVYGSVDLYRSGLLFFDPSLNKRHVVLQF